MAYRDNAGNHGRVNRPLTDDELKNILQRQVDAAIGHVGGEITSDRRKLLEQYRSEPYNIEVEGRSQVVTSDMFDTIEAMMPDLMEVFTAGDKVVEFVPQERGDEKFSEQATDYINFIVMRDNPGWTILYDWFKDALVQINGFVKVYWSDREERKTYRYSNLSADDLALLVEDDEVEVVSQDEGVSDDLTRVADELGIDLEGQKIGDIEAFVEANVPEEIRPTVRVFNVECVRAMNKGRVVVEPIPPEELIIARRSKTTDDNNFIGHKVRKTESQLIEEGFDPEIVRSIPSFDESEFNSERVSRFSRDDEYPYEDDSPDATTRPIWVIECYLNVDFDGDGLAEYRKIIVAGGEYTILYNEEVARNPFCSVTPIREPHKFFGRAFAELVADLQLINTIIWRQVLDNMYQLNNARTVINERIDMDDMLSNIIGGTVLAEGSAPVGDAVMPLVTQPIGPMALPLIEHVQTQRETRTGVTRYSQGLDADSLNKTATGISRIMARTQRRIQLVARLFAESGVKDLFKKTLAEVIEHQDEARAVRLRGKEWVDFDPREWNADMDLIVNVGLGYGTPESRQEGANAIIQLQRGIVELQQGIEGPFVMPHHVSNGLEAVVEGFGFRSAEPYFARVKEGTQLPQKQPQPDPAMMKIQGDLEAKKAELQMKQAEVQQNAQIKQAEAAQKAQLETEKMQLEHQRDMERMQAEIGMKRDEMAARIAMERELAEQRLAIDAGKTAADIDLAKRKEETDMAIALAKQEHEHEH